MVRLSSFFGLHIHTLTMPLALGFVLVADMVFVQQCMSFRKFFWTSVVDELYDGVLCLPFNISIAKIS